MCVKEEYPLLMRYFKAGELKIDYTKELKRYNRILNVIIDGKPVINKEKDATTKSKVN